MIQNVQCYIFLQHERGYFLKEFRLRVALTLILSALGLKRSLFEKVKLLNDSLN
jgi:hypothetical protein